MIRVNSKKTIHQVADTSFKADKVRNLFAVIAIILTAVLFSGLFTIADSLLGSMEESMMWQVGGSSHGGFKYLTWEQYEVLKKHPSIKEISYTVMFAPAENEELAKRPTEIRYVNDELGAEMFFALPTTGRLPQEEDEIATDTLVLNRLGIPAELGQKVTLDFSVCGEKYRETFTLVGFWEGDIISGASQAWLDRDYVNHILAQYDQEEINARGNPGIGTVAADFNFANSRSIEKKIIKVITDSGYTTDEIRYGVNWAYAGGQSMDPGIVIGVVIVVLMIMFCGYLMISNVFLISVAKDVRFYGLLKTIGMTGKQIKYLIRRQALVLCLIGIPIGLLLGCLAGGILTPLIVGGLTEAGVVKVSLHPWVFLFAAAFAAATVFISIRKPSKTAAKISPIEALRTNEGALKIKGTKKRSKGVSLFAFAWGNMVRGIKKTCLVVLSLSLSLIILNTAYSMANGFDMEKYLSAMISHDFSIGDVSCFNVLVQYVDQDTLSDDFIEILKNSPGVESLETIYFEANYSENMDFALDDRWNGMAEIISEELGISGEYLMEIKKRLENGMFTQYVYGLDDPVWEDMKVFEGSIDLEKLHSGDYVVVSPYDPDYDSNGKVTVYHPGDKVKMFGKDGESKEREVIAIANIPYNISIQYSPYVYETFFVPSDVFLNEIADKVPFRVTLDVEDSQIDNMERFLADYCENVEPNMQYESRAIFAAEYESTRQTYKTVGAVISALLALIGIANFTNTNLTSIMTRKRELALLESIGMTVKQQRGMLILEGALYTIFTAVVTWTLGIALGRLGLGLLFSGSSYFSVQFTILPSVVCLPVLLTVTGAIPVVCQYYVNKKSVVDRLREME